MPAPDAQLRAAGFVVDEAEVTYGGVCLSCQSKAKTTCEERAE